MRNLLFLLVLLPYVVFADMDANTNTDDSDQNRCQIELLVIRNVNAQSHVDDWQSPMLMNTSNAIDLVLPEFSINDEPPNFSLLPTEKMSLNREETRLVKNQNYQVLLHIAWVQNVEDKWHSKSVHIAGGHNYTIEGELANEVEGTVTVSQDKFINIKTDLCFTEPTDSIDFSQMRMSNQFYNLPQILSYHITQSRRMRAGELNYLDNPSFGVLVKVTPLNNA